MCDFYSIHYHEEHLMAAAITTVPHPLDNIDTDFIEHIESQVLGADKWTDDEMYEFIDELDDIGITSAEEFENRFYSVMDDSHKVEAEFAEEFIDNVYNTNTVEMQAVYHAIDFQRVWDHSLCYDFDWMCFNGDVYFFQNC